MTSERGFLKMSQNIQLCKNETMLVFTQKENICAKGMNETS